MRIALSRVCNLCLLSPAISILILVLGLSISGSDSEFGIKKTLTMAEAQSARSSNETYRSNTSNSYTVQENNLNSTSSFLPDKTIHKDTNILTYTNPIYGINTEYPADWSIKETPNAIVHFASPPENQNDRYFESVEIYVYVPGSLTYYPSADTPFDDKLIEEEVKYLNNTYDGFKLIGSKPIEPMQNVTAHELRFRYTDPYNGPTEAMEVISKNDTNNNIYILFYNAMPDRYSYYLPAVQRMIDSFHVVNATTVGTVIDKSTNQSNFYSYDNPSFGIRMKYPGDWVENKYGPNRLTFSSPTTAESISDKDIAIFSITTVPYEANKTAPLPPLNIFANRLISNYYKSIADFEVVESTPVTFSKIPAHKISYTFTSLDNGKSKATEILTVKNDRVYSLSYSARDLTYNIYFSVAKQMLDSIEIISAQNDTALSSLNWLIYSNPTYNIQLEYPSTWEKIDQALPFIEDIVLFKAPLDNDTDTFSERIAFSVDSYVKNVTLDEFGNSTINRIEQSGAKMIESIEPTTISGYPALKIIYTDKSNQTSFSALKVLRVIAVIDSNKAYLIEYLAQPERFEMHMPVAQQIIDSIKINRDDAQHFITYDNPAYKFKIQYPKGWRSTSPGFHGDVIGFFAPFEDTSDDYFENVRIRVENITSTEEILTTSYNETLEIDRYTNEHTDLLKEKLSNFQLVASNQTMIGPDKNITTNMVIFSFKDEPNDIKMMQLVTIRNGKLYLITYDSELSKFQQYLPIVTKMIDSFDILEKPSGSLNFLTYENPTFGFRMHYPSDWIKSEYDVNDVTFGSPITNGQESQSVSILILKLSEEEQSQPLDELANRQINARQSLADFKVESLETITVKGYPAYLLVYSYYDTYFGPTKAIEIGAVVNDSVYLVKYFAQSNKFLEVLPTFQQMVDSMEIDETSVSLSSLPVHPVIEEGNNDYDIITVIADATKRYSNVLLGQSGLN